MPGPGVHGLTCVGRDGTACTKNCAAVPSAHLAVVWRLFTQLFFLGRRRCRTLAFFLFSVFCSSTCSGGFLFGSLAFWVLLVAGRLGRRRLVAARRGRRVCPVWLAVLGPRGGGARSPVSLGLPSLLALFSGSPCTSSIFSQFLYLGRFAAFSELRGTRQVERFVAYSFRHLLQVVFHPGG